MNTINQDLLNQVLANVNQLEGNSDDTNDEGEALTAYDFLEDVLDINWILNNDRTLKGARLLVCFGGPNVWVDTCTNQVEGYWGGDSITRSYTDEIGIADTIEELYNC